MWPAKCVAVCSCMSVLGWGAMHGGAEFVQHSKQFAGPQCGASKRSGHSLRSSVLGGWGSPRCLPAALPKARGEGPGHLPEVTLSLSCPPSFRLQRSRCFGRSRGCGRRCRWPSSASSPRRPRAWPGPRGGLSAAADPCPSTDRQEDRVLDPALSQKLSRWTDGQAADALLSWSQTFVPGQTGPPEPTRLPSSVAHSRQETSKEAPKTEELGPILRGSALRRGSPGQHPLCGPGTCCLQVPCCCHVLRKGPRWVA